MNQTKKRLRIINLAISITDTETIDIQVSKLMLLQSDSKIQDIIVMLNKKNYVEAQELIGAYIETSNEGVAQRTFSPEKNTLTLKEKIQEAKDKTIIKKFELFTDDDSESTKPVNFDALLNVEAKDVLKNNMNFDIAKEEVTTQIENIQINDDEKKLQEQKRIEKTTNVKSDSINTPQTITSINDTFLKMQKKYPPTYIIDKNFDSVHSWLLKISKEDYDEKDIEEIIKYIHSLKQINKAEAAQLLLATVATKSKYALFTLGRALYKGDIIQRNLKEAFSLINQLAIEDEYPEAICDLAQFYENGIGINKDINRAKELYYKSMNLGMQRAERHYKRLEKNKKGFFSLFKN